MNSSQNAEVVKLRVELDKVTSQYNEVCGTLQSLTAFINKIFPRSIPTEVNNSKIILEFLSQNAILLFKQDFYCYQYVFLPFNIIFFC